MLFTHFKFKRLCLVTCLAMCCGLLTGCGGGSGGDGSNVSPDTPHEHNVDEGITQENPAQQYLNTADIPVPDDFDFDSDRELVLTLDSDWLDREPAYLSVCHVVAEDVDLQTTVQYDNCLLRTWVRTRGSIYKLQTTSDTTQLVVVLWRPQIDNKQQLFGWRLDQGNKWLINEQI